MEKNRLQDININTNEKEVNAMPAIELIEYERIAYIKEMKDYLSMLKALPGEEAVKKSRENLIKSNILQENGEFTEQYRYSKIYTRKFPSNR